MNNCNCNPCKKDCDPCKKSCDPCKKSCDPCGNPCGGCKPAAYDCSFNIEASPYDPSTWLVTQGCMTHKIRVPKINETCTDISTNFSTASLTYKGECGDTTITGRQIGELINLEDLRDVDAHMPDSCDILVFDPGCTECEDGCKPKPAMWRKYHIPDAGDCVIEQDSDGYYRVLVKDGCGCIKECRLPVVPNGSTVINYVRDSVPDDPDFPWYYGQYNDTINLHLEDNAPQYFGKYDLEVTVNYGIQVVKSDNSMNANFRSLVVPVVEGDSPNVIREASTLQSWAMSHGRVDDLSIVPQIPWGTTSLRGSFTFIVPKGKDAYLHHEFRLRTIDSFPNYKTNALDGQKVPDDIAGQINRMLWNASRLNALQVIVRPANGVKNMDPVTDPDRSQLDPAVDEYPSLG